MLDPAHFRFHHLGVACRNLDRELAGWLALGYVVEGPGFVDPVQKIRGQFIVGAGPRLELLAPAEAGSPIEGFLDRGTKIYHQAFEARHFEDGLRSLQNAGARLTSGPVPAVAFGGRRIAFLMTPTLNLIEIIEAAE